MSTTQAPLMLSVSGCRGIVGESLTTDVARAFAASFGAWLSERVGRAEPGRDLGVRPVTVAIGRDGRARGETIHKAAIRGLLGAGCRVLDLDVATTPTVAVAVDRHEADGGMVVTASHNPQEWNGLKCLLGGDRNMDHVGACAPPAALAAEIIERFRSGATGGGRTGELESAEDAAADHAHLVGAALEHVAGPETGAIGAGRRVVLDSVNASGARPGRLLLESLGCEVVHLNDSDSGLFPHPPEPTRENLVSLCDAVRQHRAHIGFAQDPDADRLAIIDEQGRYIGEEYTLALAAEAVLGSPMFRDRARGSILAANLSTSRMIDDVAAAHGATVVRTAVGEANVVEAMKSRRAVLGGEGNGGVIWPRVTYVRDSLGAMALVLALMSRTGKKVSELAAALPAYAIEKRKMDLASRDEAAAAVDKVTRAYSGERLDTQDGVRVDFDSKRAWLHVRPSNTEPIMRLIAEAPTPEAAREILDEAARVIG